MNNAELKEIRRRLKPERSNATVIYGRYVNGEGKTLARIKEPVSELSNEEAEKYFDTFRKPLSGKLGKTLIPISFSARQEEGGEYQRLFKIWQNRMQDQQTIERLFDSIVSGIDLDGNFVALLMMDAYDVPVKDSDGEDESDETFHYMVCAICPVKHGKIELDYMDTENRFHDTVIRQMIGAPSLGFMFPSFTDRATDLHSAMVYSAKTDPNWEVFVRGTFGIGEEMPLTGEEKKAKFDSMLSEALADSCDFNTVHSMHEELATQLLIHKEAKEQEPLVITPNQMSTILSNAGVDKRAVYAVEEGISDLVQKDQDGIQADIITDAAKMVIEADGVKLTAKPEMIGSIETITLHGKPAIAFRVSGTCKINGVEVHF